MTMQHAFRSLFGALLFFASAGIAHAVMITGSMGLTGNFSANDALDAATSIILNSAIGTSGTDNLGATVGFGTGGTVINGVISLNAFAPSANLLQIGGWQLDLTSLSITDQQPGLLTMSGSGLLSGNGFYATAANWSFSAQTASSYSMTVSAIPASVPEPGPLALLGLGICLVGFARHASKRT